MPPGVDTGQARTDLYGLGKGDAQVFDLSNAQDQLMQNRQMKFAKDQAAEKRKNEKEDDIYAGLGDVDKISIYADHRPEFAKLQGDLSTFVRKNIQKLREGDPQTTMEYQTLKSSILTQAELSKNFREQKERMGLEILKDPESFRDESIDYFTNTGRNEDGSMSFEINPDKVKKNYDLDVDFGAHVRPRIEEMAQGESVSFRDAEGNEYSVDKNSFDEKHATAILQDRLKDPKVNEQALYNYNKLPKEEQAKYAGFSDYYVKKMLPYALVNKDKKVSKAATDKEGKASIETSSDEENPMTFKVEQVKTGQKLNPSQQAIVNLSEEEAAKLTPQQQSQRKEWMEGKTKVVTDVPMAAKATHTKPIKANTAITENMRTLTGGKIPTGVEIRDAEYGQTAVMPFIKTGKGKGDLINKEDLQTAEKDGNIEWKVGVTGTLKYGTGTKAKEVSIVRPADEIKSALDKHVDLGELQKIADQKNAAKKKAPAGKTLSIATIKAKVGTPGFEGYTEQELIDYYKSQGYNIK